MMPLVGLIVFMGVYPKPVLDRIEPSVERLITHVEDNSDYREPSVSSESAETDTQVGVGEE
jgi:NADH-quinone oxidoreductase subunit M